MVNSAADPGLPLLAFTFAQRMRHRQDRQVQLSTKGRTSNEYSLHNIQDNKNPPMASDVLYSGPHQCVGASQSLSMRGKHIVIVLRRANCDNHDRNHNARNP